MNNDKKHVIPRDKYRRKRHEYFHNEEREARIKREKEQRERLAQKEQQQAKLNEERVKDNLRKARIEKLTQEEIQQQQHLAKLRAENESTSKVEGNSKDSHNLTLPEEQHLKKENKSENKDNKISDNARNQNQTTSIDGNKNDTNSSQPEYSRLRKNKEKEEQSTIKKEKNKKKQANLTTHQQEHGHKSSKSNDTAKVDKLTDNAKSGKARKDEHKTTLTKETNDSSKRLDDQTSNDNDKAQAHTSSKEKQADDKDKPASNNTNFMDQVKAFFKLHWVKIVIVVAIILIILLLNAIISNINQGSSVNQSESNHTKYTSTMKNANNTVKSVVTVESDAPKKTSVQQTNTNSNSELGSGVVYKKVGDAFFILTNTHIISDSDKIKVTYGDHTSTQASVIGKDKWSDIAVIKANIKDQNIKPIEIGDSSKLVLGESIIVVGNPLGEDFRNSVSKGIVSGLNRAVAVDFNQDSENDERIKAFQIDASVNPGNSGGAVVNDSGRLVGIVSLKINMPNIEGMGFAIPINDAMEIANELEKKGKIDYPNTGIAIENVQDLNSYEREILNVPNDIANGIVVEKLKDGGLGEKSGLKTGDVVVELDSKTIKNNLDYRQIIFNHRQDLATLTGKIYRDGKSQEIKIKLK